ncbi:DUF402 domain-containing protein [Streptomyces sp. NPDC056255]|uniref:DUF402 domain-containing protein n=1 Tax=Streptomyces sp. NPDC056255 TaxID=3345764 RepID=UPI0035DCA979
MLVLGAALRADLSAAWFSVHAFFVPDSGGGRRLRNRYVNFERPTRRAEGGYDTFDLAVDLVVTPDLTRWEWEDEDETRTCVASASSPAPSTKPSTNARAEVLAILAARAGLVPGRLRAGGTGGVAGGGSPSNPGRKSSEGHTPRVRSRPGCAAACRVGSVLLLQLVGEGTESIGQLLLGGQLIHRLLQAALQQPGCPSCFHRSSPVLSTISSCTACPGTAPWPNAGTSCPDKALDARATPSASPTP